MPILVLPISGHSTQQIATARVVSTSALDGSKSKRAKKLTLLSTDGGQRLEVVWKAATTQGETRGGNVPAGQAYKRELAAYLIASALRLTPVPPVVVRLVGGVRGTAMLFVHAPTWKESALEFDDAPVVEWQKLALLDWLLGSLDRHRRNWLVTEDRTFVAIDNGLCLPEREAWGRWRGYRSKPHRLLSDNGGLHLPEVLVERLTSRMRARIEGIMASCKIGTGARRLFSARFDRIARGDGTLPDYVADDKGFMEPMRLEGAE